MQRLTLLLVATFLLLGLLAVGGFAWWRQDSLRRRNLALKRVEQRMKELRAEAPERKRSFADRRGWPWPPPEPTEPPAQALRLARQEIGRRLDDRLPPSTGQAIMREAERRYGLREKGDRVSFRLRGGVGVQTQVSGTLYNITDERIQVGRQWFNKEDLPPTARVHFDPALSRKKIRDYVNSGLKRFREQRKALRRDITMAVMAERGYAARPSAPEPPASSPAPEWTPMAETIDVLFARWLDAERTEEEEEAFEEQGFVRLDGKWRRPTPWSRFRAAFRREG